MRDRGDLPCGLIVCRDREQFGLTLWFHFTKRHWPSRVGLAFQDAFNRKASVIEDEPFRGASSRAANAGSSSIDFEPSCSRQERIAGPPAENTNSSGPLTGVSSNVSRSDRRRDVH